jgi:serine/threonine-protein kinase
MSLGPGTRLGPYEILSAIGAGGMGEVYRAIDTSLGRQVAIKVLPEAFASDPERLARFEREAKTLASLNHPHIAQIYGLERSGGVQALVMELVPGEDLSQRIVRGPIPLDEALPIARQIAEALEAAHEQGIIHRDLKPANIKVTPDGVVKVLDFGLAKLSESRAGAQPAAGRAHLSMSPTIMSPAVMTGVGVLLGTAAYMAPEQAKGHEADKRSDIWAFGCVLYEMLTGTRPFDGEDVTDTLANILKVDTDWHMLPGDVPVAIRTLLKNCLQKDRRKRLGDIAAALFVIEHAGELAERVGVDANRSSSESLIRPKRWHVWVLGIAAVMTAIVATLGGVRYLATSPAQPVTRFDVNPPHDQVFPGAQGIPRFSVSPDGRSVVFAAGMSNTGPYQLWVRRFDQVDAQPLGLTASDNANAVQGMFWLPEGDQIGFFDEVSHKLKTVDVRGEMARTLVDVPSNQGSGTGNGAGTILYSSLGTGGIMRIAVTGGVPQKVTGVRDREIAHLWPYFLPDGNHFVYLSQTAERADWALYVGSVKGPDRTLLVRAASMGQFAPPDQLLYVRGDALFAQRIDLERFALQGDPILIAQPVSVTNAGRAAFSVSNTGVLVHASDVGVGTSPRVVTWIDRGGREEPLGVPIHTYSHLALSPDGARVALSSADQERNLWIWSLTNKSLTRLTFGLGQDTSPVWTPDSRQIIFQSNPTGPFRLYSVAADGTGMPARLLDTSANQGVSSVTPDGAELIFDEDTTDTGVDVRAVMLNAPHRVRTLIKEPLNDRNGIVSPDGRWMAYQSSQSGPYQIYVRPYPAVENGRWQVSTNGGVQPLWSRDGKELFFLSSDLSLMAVRVESGNSWTAGTSTRLFADPGLSFTAGNFGGTGRTYDVSPDGRRFLVLKLAASAPSDVSTRLVVVQNWTEELKRLVPTK